MYHRWYKPSFIIVIYKKIMICFPTIMEFLTSVVSFTSIDVPVAFCMWTNIIGGDLVHLTLVFARWTVGWRIWSIVSTETGEPICGWVGLKQCGRVEWTEHYLLRFQREREYIYTPFMGVEYILIEKRVMIDNKIIISFEKVLQITLYKPYFDAYGNKKK